MALPSTVLRHYSTTRLTIESYVLSKTYRGTSEKKKISVLFKNLEQTQLHKILLKFINRKL